SVLKPLEPPCLYATLIMLTLCDDTTIGIQMDIRHVIWYTIYPALFLSLAGLVPICPGMSARQCRGLGNSIAS
ncbi:hypothetical protein B0H17DRAFT_1074232, partial [Mycena rosella]